MLRRNPAMFCKVTRRRSGNKEKTARYFWGLTGIQWMSFDEIDGAGGMPLPGQGQPGRGKLCWLNSGDGLAYHFFAVKLFMQLFHIQVASNP